MPPAPTRITGIASIAFAALIGCTQPPAANDAPETAAKQQTQPEGTGDVASLQNENAAGHAHTNRLVNETSPYLLQHAHNPVDWYPWGDEALAKAKEEDKPIFLSVGYSSCHWCHVMEHESFESEEIAAVMNAHFINIKVDREERPDIDEIYMTAVQAMTGSGGWPMSVWLTPDLKPFYGGTYFPPDNRYGRPGFKAVLERVASVWKDNRGDLLESASRLTEHMEQLLSGQGEAQGEVSAAVIAAAMVDLRGTFDKRDGGFGGAPKFPSAPSIQVLLREYNRTGDHGVLNMATLTLDKMAAGGMYDHLAGGFARYSTDAQWLVPHFEKMLYDNAQLAQAYLEAYQVTGNPSYRRIVEETFEYILRDMRDARGGFHSAEDADSEGEEGKFYVWTHEEIVGALGADDAEYFNEFYNARPGGNFDSHEPYHAEKNILHITTPIEEFANAHGQTTDEALSKLAAMRETLLEIRNKRVRPGLDDKVLSSWNALMISAFAQGYQILGDTRYRGAAAEAAEFIMTGMMRDGELLRTHRHGESRLPAYLDDYAFMIAALMDVYEATFDVRWIDRADALTKTMIAKFWDEESDGFYFTSDDHTNLIVRTRPTYDGAIPSGNSVAALALLRLAKFIDSPDYYDKARQILESNAGNMRRVPRGFIKMIVAADFILYPPKEIAIAGEAESDGVGQLLSALRGAYVPNKIVAFVEPGAANAGELAERMPLLASKSMIDGKAAAYVCKDFACKRPVTEVDAFLEQLEVRKD